MSENNVRSSSLIRILCSFHKKQSHRKSFQSKMLQKSHNIKGLLIFYLGKLFYTSLWK